jgi:hypothetical protein
MACCQSFGRESREDLGCMSEFFFCEARNPPVTYIMTIVVLACAALKDRGDTV